MFLQKMINCGNYMLFIISCYKLNSIQIYEQIHNLSTLIEGSKNTKKYKKTKKIVGIPSRQSC